jgi:hypothetical protein
LAEINKNVENLKEISNSLRQKNIEKTQTIQSLQSKINAKNLTLSQLHDKTMALDMKNQSLAIELMQIRTSREWKHGVRLSRLFDALVPPKSMRSKFLDSFSNKIISPIFYRKRLKKEKGNIAMIQSSGYFDEDWYLAHYPDVASTGMKASKHYLLNGGFEGRDPGPNFSSAAYLAAYQDVREASINPLVHYLKFGKAEGRDIQSSNET